MSCSLEMVNCDGCGREILLAGIYIVKNEAGERQWLCAECAGHGRVGVEGDMIACGLPGSEESNASPPKTTA